MKIQNAEQLQQELDALSKKTFLFSSSLSKAIDTIYHNTNFTTPITSEQSVTILQACHTLQQKEARFTGLWSKVFGKPQTSSLSALEQKTITQTGSLTQDTAKEFFERTLRSLGATEQQVNTIRDKIIKTAQIISHLNGTESLLSSAKEFLSLIAECKEKKIDLPADLPDPFAFLEKLSTNSLNNETTKLRKHLKEKIFERDQEIQSISINQKIEECKIDLLVSCIPSDFNKGEFRSLITRAKYQPEEKIPIISQMNLISELIKNKTPDEKKRIIDKIKKQLDSANFWSRGLTAEKFREVLNKNIVSLWQASEAIELLPLSKEPPDSLLIESFKISISYFNKYSIEYFNLIQAVNEKPNLNEKIAFIEICEKVFSCFHDASEEDKKAVLNYLKENIESILENRKSEDFIGKIEKELEIKPSDTENPYNTKIKASQKELVEFYNTLQGDSLNLTTKTASFIFRKNLMRKPVIIINNALDIQKQIPEDQQSLFFYECSYEGESFSEESTLQTHPLLSRLRDLEKNRSDIVSLTNLKFTRKEIKKELDKINYEQKNQLEQNLAQIFDNPQQTPTLDKQLQIAKSILESLQSVKDLNEQQKKQTLDYLLTYTPNSQTL